MRLITFSVEDFFCFIRRLKVTPAFIYFGEIRKNYIILRNFDRIKKGTLLFLSYSSIESIRNNSFKAYKFLNTRVHGKYILASSRARFTRLLYLKMTLIQLIKSFYFDFVLSYCPSDIIHYFLTVPKTKISKQALFLVIFYG